MSLKSIPPRPNPSVPSLIIVSGVRLYREGLATVLGQSQVVAIVGVADDGASAVELAVRLRPDIAVVDMSTGDSLESVAALRLECPALRIVVVAIEETDSEVMQCAEAGVAGFVSYEATVDDLVNTVLGVAKGELRCSPRAAAVVLGRVAAQAGLPTQSRAALLTGRERQVAVLLHRGLSNKEIGSELHIGVATVKNHLHHIFEKLQVGTRAEAAARLRLHPGRWSRRSAQRSTSQLD